jgi:hypothetical protein
LRWWCWRLVVGHGRIRDKVPATLARAISTAKVDRPFR